MHFNVKNTYIFIIASFNATLSIHFNISSFIRHQTIPLHKSQIYSNLGSMTSPIPESQPTADAKEISKEDKEHFRTTIKRLKEESEANAAKTTKEEREKEVNAWRVVLYNDDIHNFSYVTESISACVPQLSLAKAHLITVEAHRTGQAEVIRTWREKAESYCRGILKELQKYGLTVCTINDHRRK